MLPSIASILSFIFKILSWQHLYRKKLSLVLVALTFWGHLSSAYNNHVTDPKAFVSEEDRVLTTLSLRQKVQQLFVIGFSGTQYNQGLEPRLKNGVPGGVIIFHRNIRQPTDLAQLTHLAQSESLKQTSLPMFVMMDQEGGQVSRLRTNPPPPSALALGESRDETLTRAVGFVVGRLLNVVGVNMNLAPVLDLSNPFAKSFIGNRSFGQSPQVVSQISQAFVDGMKQAGVLAVAKHFPGHGDTVGDSHKGAISKYSSKEEMLETDLLPFLRFARMNPLSAMMVAHVSYPKIDNSLLPATYSRPILNDLLREQLQYQGLVITDDLEMLGAAGVGNIEERAVRALEAGADLMMVAWSPNLQKRAISGVLNALKSGRISEERVNQSVRRIVRLKLSLRPGREASLLNAQKTIHDFNLYARELRQLSQKITYRNFANSWSKISPQIPKAEGEQSRAVIFSADQRFFHSFRKAFQGSSAHVRISHGNDGNVYKHLIKDNSAFGIFYASGVLSAKLAQQIHPAVRSRVFIINTNHPGIIQDQEGFAGVIHIQTRDSDSGAWIAQALNQNRSELRFPSSQSEIDRTSEENPL